MFLFYFFFLNAVVEIDDSKQSCLPTLFEQDCNHEVFNTKRKRSRPDTAIHACASFRGTRPDSPSSLAAMRKGIILARCVGVRFDDCYIIYTRLMLVTGHVRPCACQDVQG